MGRRDELSWGRTGDELGDEPCETFRRAEFRASFSRQSRAYSARSAALTSGDSAHGSQSAGQSSLELGAGSSLTGPPPGATRQRRGGKPRGERLLQVDQDQNLKGRLGREPGSQPCGRFCCEECERHSAGARGAAPPAEDASQLRRAASRPSPYSGPRSRRPASAGASPARGRRRGRTRSGRQSRCNPERQNHNAPRA